jgi:zinc resistance-associated protein
VWRSVLAATAATVIAASSLVYAQHQHAGFGGPHWRPSPEDLAAFTDARIAGLKAGLKLTPDQEKNWPAFEQAFREVAKQRAEHMKERFEQREHEHQADQKQTDNVNPIERLQKRADALSARGAALKKLAGAAAPLYQSLDDGQKRRFAFLSRMGHQHRQQQFGFWHRHHDGDDGDRDGGGKL